jgi:iron(III) transport system permease protein
MTPALAGIGLLQFVRGLEAFEVPLLMGLPKGIRVFSTNIYWVVRETNPPEYGLGFVYGITLVIVAMVGLFIYQRMMGRAGQFATITGKGYRPRLIDLGRGRWFAGGFIIFFLFVAIVLPFLVLLFASFLPFYMAPSARAWASLTLVNYDTIFNSSQVLLAIRNTALLCGITSVGGMLVATIISWVVIRLRTKGSRVLDALVFIPYAIPSVAMGFAFLIVFLQVGQLGPPFNWFYGAIWALVVVYLVRFLPMGTRFTHAGMAQIKAELEEAAAASGAGFLTIVWRIIIPLMLPSLVAGGLYIFLLSMKVMSMAAMLMSPESFVLSIMIFQLWNEGSIPEVGSLSVLMIFVGTVLTIVSRRLAQRRAVVSEH